MSAGLALKKKKKKKKDLCALDIRSTKPNPHLKIGVRTSELSNFAKT